MEVKEHFQQDLNNIEIMPYAEVGNPRGKLYCPEPKAEGSGGCRGLTI